MTETLRGCGRCYAPGWREIAHHHPDRAGRLVVDTLVAYCDCPRGTHWSAQRALPLRPGEPSRSPGTRLADAVTALRRRPTAHLEAVYVDPTPAQRSPPPPDTPERRAWRERLLAMSPRAVVAAATGPAEDQDRARARQATRHRADTDPEEVTW